MTHPGEPRRLHVFERYLTVWVGLCMIAGIGFGKLPPGVIDALRRVESGARNPLHFVLI
ncbi:MAG: hypothetical protein AABZ12_13165 [Planctomycetota bacterium]